VFIRVHLWLIFEALMDRSNHYEAAFEAFLRARGVGFVAVDEARRTLLGDADVKSLDFIVVGPHDARLVVDVKGRRFPGGPSGQPRKVWQNWSTEDDLDGLGRWAHHFGPDFRGVLATYLMRAVEATAYRSRMKPRSRRWGTVHLATADYRELVLPFSAFLKEPTTEAQRTQRKDTTEKTNI
jgi:hypothetical protein